MHANNYVDVNNTAKCISDMTKVLVLYIGIHFFIMNNKQRL